VFRPLPRHPSEEEANSRSILPAAKSGETQHTGYCEASGELSGGSAPRHTGFSGAESLASPLKDALMGARDPAREQCRGAGVARRASPRRCKRPFQRRYCLPTPSQTTVSETWRIFYCPEVQ